MKSIIISLLTTAFFAFGLTACNDEKLPEGHYEGDGHDHSGHYEGDGHDHTPEELEKMKADEKKD